MKNERAELLYVGKAKNLRTRLRSYTHANPESASKKVLQLVQAVRTIEWNELENEKEALLRENALLREHRPPMNVANNSSHTYLFFHLRKEDEGVRVHIGMAPNPAYPDVYGSFKGLGLGLRAYKALLRLLWIRTHGIENLSRIPAPLVNRRQLPEFLVPMADRLGYRALKQYLNGTAKSVTGTITRLLARDDLDAFAKKLLEQDLETLTQFHETHAKRNREMKIELEYPTELIPQDRLDDLLVLRTQPSARRVESTDS